MGCGASSPETVVKIPTPMSPYKSRRATESAKDEGGDGEQAGSAQEPDALPNTFVGENGEIDDEALEKAATKIQALHRGKQSRKGMEDVRARCKRDHSRKI